MHRWDTIDHQQPFSDWQQPHIQPEKYQHIRHQKHRRTPWQWYRSRSCKLKEGLVYRTFVTWLLFCFSITIISGCGNQVSTRSVSPAAPGIHWESFSALFQQTYNELFAITSKPMMIGEMASTEQDGNKAAWISDAYASQIPHNFSRIRAVIWFDQDKETDWRIESSVAAQNAFSTAIQSYIYAANRYFSLNVSPIPVP